jgi:hypothetical protein
MGRACGVYGKGRVAYRILVGNLREEGQLEDIHIDGRITVKFIFK